MAGPIRIGTAGWSIPRINADQFSGDGSHLHRYARRMNTAEINTSFYRPHKVATYARWAESTPETFRFSVKAPRLLTHDQRLGAPEAGLDRFAAEVAGLGHRLGVVLVQLPPNLTFEPRVAAAFFEAMRQRLPTPVACEPRHASWFSDEADALLVEHRIARVAADPARIDRADQLGGWRGLAYVRLHGSPRIYYSAYDPVFLAEQAARLGGLAKLGPVWCILDNTAGSAALGDALAIQAALHPSD